MKFVAFYGDGGKIIAIELKPLLEAISLYKKGLILMASATLSEAYARVYHASREMSTEVWVAGEDEFDLPFTPGTAVLVLGFLFPEDEERGEMPVGVMTFDPHPVLHTPLLVVSPTKALK